MASHSDRNPALALVLSLLVPGIGQIYTGNIVWAIIWLIITPGLWIGTGGCLGWVCHILAGVQAYHQAATSR